MLLGEFSGMMVAIGCIWWLIGSEHERWLTVSIKMKVFGRSVAGNCSKRGDVDVDRKFMKIPNK